MVDSTLVHFELADLIGDLNQNVGVIFQKRYLLPDILLEEVLCDQLPREPVI